MKRKLFARLFVVEDKLSMAHGLKSSFLDNDLVDFAMNCPVDFKIKNIKENYINENEHGDKPTRYFEKTNDGKQILRDVMSNYIPMI